MAVQCFHARAASAVSVLRGETAGVALCNSRRHAMGKSRKQSKNAGKMVANPMGASLLEVDMPQEEQSDNEQESEDEVTSLSPPLVAARAHARSALARVAWDEGLPATHSRLCGQAMRWVLVSGSAQSPTGGRRTSHACV